MHRRGLRFPPPPPAPQAHPVKEVLEKAKQEIARLSKSTSKEDQKALQKIKLGIRRVGDTFRQKQTQTLPRPPTTLASTPRSPLQTRPPEPPRERQERQPYYVSPSLRPKVVQEKDVTEPQDMTKPKVEHTEPQDMTKPKVEPKPHDNPRPKIHIGFRKPVEPPVEKEEAPETKEPPKDTFVPLSIPLSFPPELVKSLQDKTPSFEPLTEPTDEAFWLKAKEEEESLRKIAQKIEEDALRRAQKARLDAARRRVEEMEALGSEERCQTIGGEREMGQTVNKPAHDSSKVPIYDPTPKLSCSPVSDPVNDTKKDDEPIVDIEEDVQTTIPLPSFGSFKGSVSEPKVEKPEVETEEPEVEEKPKVVKNETLEENSQVEEVQEEEEPEVEAEEPEVETEEPEVEEKPKVDETHQVEEIQEVEEPKVDKNETLEENSQEEEPEVEAKEPEVEVEKPKVEGGRSVQIHTSTTKAKDLPPTKDAIRTVSVSKETCGSSKEGEKTESESKARVVHLSAQNFSYDSMTATQARQVWQSMSEKKRSTLSRKRLESFCKAISVTYKAPRKTTIAMLSSRLCSLRKEDGDEKTKGKETEVKEPQFENEIPR